MARVNKEKAKNLAPEMLSVLEEIKLWMMDGRIICSPIYVRDNKLIEYVNLCNKVYSVIFRCKDESPLDDVIAEQQDILRSMQNEPETKERRKMRLVRHLMFGNGDQETIQECNGLTEDEVNKLLNGLDE